jgi:hypothetical protein
MTNMNVSGKWTISAEAMGQPVTITMDLTQNGDGFSGKLSSMLGEGTLNDGKISENKITGTAKISVMNQDLELKMNGTIEGDSMSGTLDSPLGVIPFTATKSI